MRRFFVVGAVLGGLMALAGPGALEAQTATQEAPSTNDSAYVALRVMAKTLGKDSLDHVVEVAGRDGVPQPYLWKVILEDGAGGMREVDVAGGKVTAQRPSPKPPASKEVIHLQDLNLDSSGAFDATDAQARKVRLRFDSVNYVLRAGETNGKPQWTLSLFDKEGADVGAMHLAANDGTITAIDGRLESGPPTPSHTPAVASSGHATESTTTVVRQRESVPTTTRATESRTTTTTTTVVGNPPFPPPPPPPPPPPATSDTVVVDDAPVDRGEGGLFTRTGRTLDKTSRTVEDTLRRTGSRVQRFFTGGHSDAPEPTETPHGPDYRGD